MALQRVEQPAIQYTAALSTVAEACPAPGKRNLVPGTNTPYPAVSEKIRQQQQKFQVSLALLIKCIGLIQWMS